MQWFQFHLCSGLFFQRPLDMVFPLPAMRGWSPSITTSCAPIWGCVRLAFPRPPLTYGASLRMGRFSHFSSWWWASVMALLSTHLPCFGVNWDRTWCVPLVNWIPSPCSRLPARILVFHSVGDYPNVQCSCAVVDSWQWSCAGVAAQLGWWWAFVSSSPGVVFPSTYHFRIVCLARQAVWWVRFSHFRQRCCSESAQSCLPTTSWSSPCAPSFSVEPANPFSAAVRPPAPSEPANPLSAAAPTVAQVPREAIVASNPFVALHPGRSPAPPRYGGGGPFPEAGPARLTRFLEMSLDNYCATLRHGACDSGWITGPELSVGILASVVVSSTTLRIAHCRFTELQKQFSFSFHCSRVGRTLLFLNFPRFDRTMSCQCLHWMIHVFQIHVCLEVVHRTFQLPLLLRPPASVLWFISWLTCAVVIRGKSLVFMMKCRKCAPNWRLVLTRHLLCHRPHHLFLLHLFHLPRPHLLPWVGTVLFFAATLGVPTQSPRLAQFGSVKYTARALGATYTGPRLARVTSVACVVATPLSPGLVPAASAPCIAPACDARFIAGASQCVPRQIVLSSEPHIWSETSSIQSCHTQASHMSGKDNIWFRRLENFGHLHTTQLQC